MPTTTLKIQKGKESELEVAGLLFRACRREVDVIDGGITLQVFKPAEAEGDSVELLRVDCFRKGPHYHAPGDQQEENKIDAAKWGDGKRWVFEHLATEPKALLEQGGFHELASGLDLSEFSGVGARLEALFDGLEEPSEMSTFEVDSKVVEGLLAGGQ